MARARLNSVVEGPADAPVLVLGPSLGTDLGLFDAQADVLAGRHRLVRYDLRGHGGSEVVPGACTMADLADDVLGLLDELRVEQFSYAGVSIGGAIGQQLALTVPERLDRLAILASAAQFADPGSYAARAEQVRASGTEPLVASRTGTWFTADWAEQHPDGAERLLAMLRTTTPEGYAACCEAIGTFDLRDRLAEISAPTLVVAGELDPATTVDTVRLIADRVPGARFAVVPGGAHLPNATHPDVVNPLLLEHFSGS